MVGFAEIDGYCRGLLARGWPDVPIFEDVNDVSSESLRETRIDVITGGFPCQPVSIAGNRGGVNDERFMWPEFFRVIADVRPSFVIIENSPNLRVVEGGAIFLAMLVDLAGVGYAVEWRNISASELGAWHRRNRLWIVAYPDGNGQSSANVPRNGSREDRVHPLSKQQGRDECRPAIAGGSGVATSAIDPSVWTAGTARIFTREADRLLAELRERNIRAVWGCEPGVHRLVDGTYDKRVLRAMGNAVVPQVVEFIGRLILKYVESVQ